VITVKALESRSAEELLANTRLVNGVAIVDLVTIVDLSGRIVLGDGIAGLRELVHNLVSEGNKKILLNFRNVDYIDSSGLGELVSSLAKMGSQGGELKLLNLTKRVQALLQITKLYTVFDIKDDEATSVRSFSPAIWPSPLPEPSPA
jgi:anti-sigma B factor antagonist